MTTPVRLLNPGQYDFHRKTRGECDDRVVDPVVTYLEHSGRTLHYENSVLVAEKHPARRVAGIRYYKIVAAASDNCRVDIVLNFPRSDELVPSPFAAGNQKR